MNPAHPESGYSIADVIDDLRDESERRKFVSTASMMYPKDGALMRYPGEYDCGWRLSDPKALVVVWWDPEFAWTVSERRLDGIDVRIKHELPTLEAAREYAWAHRGGE